MKLFQHFVGPHHRKGNVAIGKRRDTQLSHGAEERKQFLQSILGSLMPFHNLMLWSHLVDEVQRLPTLFFTTVFQNACNARSPHWYRKDTLRPHGGSCLGDWLNCFFVHSASGRHCWKLARSVGASGVPLLWCSEGVGVGEDI